MILPATTAVETFSAAGTFAANTTGPESLRSIYEVAAEISRRSAKHSAEFLNATPMVMARLQESSRPARFSGRLPAADRKLEAGSSPPLKKEKETKNAVPPPGTEFQAGFFEPA